MSAPLEVEEIRAAAGLDALRPEWEALWRAAPAATPFQLPGWQIAWWRAFHPGRLLTLAIRRAGRLAGVLPLYVEEAPGGRKLLPIGISVSDYLDATVLADDAEAAAEAAFLHLARNAELWDVAELHELPPGAALLRGPVPASLASELQEASRVPVLPLDGKPLAEIVPETMRKNLAYYRRRADRVGVWYDRLPPKRGEEGIQQVAVLHERRWAARGRAGVFADERTRRFHVDAAQALGREGLLRLHLLRAGETPVAGIYGFHAKGRAYLYITGLDPAFAALSPGTLAIAAAVDAAIEEGCRGFDFLRGEERYKYLWGAVARPNFVRTLRRR
jgi:CelD/BcsL family acetyltransferase involved in cellulose biosynthesis